MITKPDIDEVLTVKTKLTDLGEALYLEGRFPGSRFAGSDGNRGHNVCAKAVKLINNLYFNAATGHGYRTNTLARPAK